MTNEEITKDIIITMIQQDKLHPTSKKDFEDINTSYTEAVCKAFNTVYKTVNDVSKSIYEIEID